MSQHSTLAYMSEAHNEHEAKEPAQAGTAAESAPTMPWWRAVATQCWGSVGEYLRGLWKGLKNWCQSQELAPLWRENAGEHWSPLSRSTQVAKWPELLTLEYNKGAERY